MKKSFFAIASLVFVLGLAGCTGNTTPDGKSSSQGGGEPSTTSSQGGGGDVEVPVEEGKVTVYLTAHFDGVTLPEYAAINLAGGFTSWNQGAPAETQLARLGESDIFYKQVAMPAAGDVTYKIILGYTEASGLSGGDLGVNWGNEGKGYPVDNFGPGEGGNKSMAYDGTANKVDLGEYTWNTMLDEPSPDYYDATLYVDLFEDIPDGYHVYTMGAFNGWASPIEMEKVTEAEGIRYQFAMEDLLAKEYEFKVVVHPLATDAEGFNVWSDDRYEINTQNAKFTVNALCEQGPRNIFGGNKKFHVSNQLDGVMAAAENDVVTDVVAKIVSFYGTNPYNGVYVADRGNCVQLYKTPDSVKDNLEVGATVKFSGKVAFYYDARQIQVTSVEVLEEDHNQEIRYAEVNGDFVAGLATATAGDVLNTPLHFNGKVASTDSEGAEDTEVTLQLAVAEEVTLPLYAKVDKKDAAATVAALAALTAGDDIEVWGVLGAYKGTYQLITPVLA